MSTPPFIAMPDGVGRVDPDGVPVSVLLAEPAPAAARTATGVAHGADGAAGVGGAVDALGAHRRHGADGADGARGAAGADGADGVGIGHAGARGTPRGDVLLVPGFTGSKEDFIALLRPLADRGWRVAAMDLPGQGGAAPLGGRGSHTPATLAGTVESVLDWLAPDAPAHLVGHSLGGLVTREVVIARPGRLASWVPMCSGPGPVPEAQHHALRALQQALATLPIELVWAHKEALDRAGGWTPPGDDVARFVAERFVRNDPAALADFAEMLLATADRTAEAAAAIAGAGLGGAVLTGQLDDAWPLPQQQLMAERLGRPWVVLPGVGHNPAVEDPEATATALDAVFARAAAARPVPATHG